MAQRNVYVKNPVGMFLVSHKAGPPNIPSNGHSFSPVVSGDGWVAAYTSSATDIDPDGDLNGTKTDVLRVNGTRVSGGQTAAEIISVGRDGLQDTSPTFAGATTSGGGPLGRVVNKDGSLILFHAAFCSLQAAGEDFACQIGEINCLCASPAGGCDGSCFFTFQQVYLFKNDTFTVSRVSRTYRGLFRAGNGTSKSASLNVDAVTLATAVIVFSSVAVDLRCNPAVDDPNGIEDIFMIRAADVDTPEICPVNVTLGGNGESTAPKLSPGGNEVVFVSAADNLTPDDNDPGKRDIFVADIAGGVVGTIREYSVSTSGTEANNHSSNPDIAGEGKIIVYESSATNLQSPDPNGSTWDIYETLSGGKFIRGDADGDGTLEQDDDFDFLEAYLFQGGAPPPPPCLDAANANDNGNIDISDLAVIGAGGPFPPPSPACGNEPSSSGDGFSCAFHPCQ